MKLQSAEDKWASIYNRWFGPTSISDLGTEYNNHIILLKQPIKLGQFVPCDLEGNVLSDLAIKSKKGYPRVKYESQYQAALDRVIFKGWKVDTVDSESVQHSRQSFLTVIELGNITISFYSDGRVLINEFSIHYNREAKTLSDLTKYELEMIEHQRQAYTKGIEKGLELKRDYTKEKSFWKTLDSFVKNVQVGDPMSEEEKEMILRQCELKIKDQC